MKYYKLMILMSFFSNNLHSIDFKLTPSDSFDGIEYFTLRNLHVNKVKHIDVALEGILITPLLGNTMVPVFGVKLQLD